MRPSLKKTSEPSISQKFASAHPLDRPALDGLARASSQRSEFMKVLTLVAAVLLLAAITIGAITTGARTAAPGGNPPGAPAAASDSSQNQDNPPAAQTS